jgi:hypothetical protein
MRLAQVAALAATGAQLATATPSYAIPKIFSASFLAAADCTLPGSCEILDFETCTVPDGNTTSSVVKFAYTDEATGIQTDCQYNSTSKNVGMPGLAPRYACDNPTVEFIWLNGVLTLVEAACPE